MKIKILIILLVSFLAPSLWATENQQYGNKYAVVWDSISRQNPKFKKYISKQANQLLNIWREGLIENVYLNPEGNLPKNKQESNIVFFVKAKDEASAKKILARLPFVKYNVVQYKLFPVGVLWLKQFKNDSSTQN